MGNKINWNGSDGIFSVPNAVVDCLNLASGKAIKVLLYILKYNIPDAPPAEVGRELGFSAEDVEDALLFWKQTGVITDNGISEAAVAAGAVSEKNIPEKRENSRQTSVQEPDNMKNAGQTYAEDRIAKRIAESEEIRSLISSAEFALKKELTYVEQRTFIYLHDDYGVSSELLIMIAEFANSQNKADIRFVERIALQWHEDKITTPERAEQEIIHMRNYYRLEKQITSRLELSHMLTSAEKKYIDDWAIKDIGIDLVEYAGKKTIDNLGKIKFSYMNAILLDWYNKGWTDIGIVKKVEEASNKKNPDSNDSGEHSYNLDLLVEHAMNTTPKMKY